METKSTSEDKPAFYAKGYGKENGGYVGKRKSGML